MPLYEYFCKSCDETFEVRASMNQMTQVMDCPEGHPGAKKVLSVFATVTSGKGEFSGEACAPMGCGADDCCAFSQN